LLYNSNVINIFYFYYYYLNIPLVIAIDVIGNVIHIYFFIHGLHKHIIKNTKYKIHTLHNINQTNYWLINIIYYSRLCISAAVMSLKIAEIESVFWFSDSANDSGNFEFSSQNISLFRAYLWQSTKYVCYWYSDMNTTGYALWGVLFDH